MKTRKLGPFTVSAIGLGAMPLSMSSSTKPLPEENDAIRTVHAALDAGVTFIDTADIYAPSWDTMGHNEVIVGNALKSYSGSLDGVVVGTKGGITRSEGEGWGRDGSIEYLRKAVEASLRNLRVDVIDLYQWHRPDRWMLYSEAIANFKTLQDEGKIRSIGISNANVEEIEVAEQVLGEGGLASVQNEFSPSHAGSYNELQYTGERGIAFLPWSPLGGTGGGATNVGQRFGVFQEIADAHGVSPQQVVLAWELSLGDHVIPIPGASRAASITDSVKAADLELTAEEIKRISVTIGVVID
jgi:aryl-alcohol dehydrogenase-like predicted oxidoreductase